MCYRLGLDGPAWVLSNRAPVPPAYHPGCLGEIGGKPHPCDDQNLQNRFLQKRGHCVPGANGQGGCPVAAILRYMSTRGPTEGPFFKYKDGLYLTRARFVEEVRQALHSRPGCKLASSQGTASA